MSIITSLSVTAGVASHVTVADANAGGAALPNAKISWTISDGGGALGVTVVADPAGGFNVNATSPGSGALAATYTDGSVIVHGPTLPLTVTASVALQYQSP